MTSPRRASLRAAGLTAALVLLSGCAGGGSGHAAGALEVPTDSGGTVADRPAGVSTFWASFGDFTPCLRASAAGDQVLLTRVRLDDSEGVVAVQAGVTHGTSDALALGRAPGFAQAYAGGPRLTDYTGLATDTTPAAPSGSSGVAVATTCSEEQGPRDPELVVSIEAGATGASAHGFDVDYTDDGTARTVHVPWSLRLCANRARGGCRGRG